MKAPVSAQHSSHTRGHGLSWAGEAVGAWGSERGKAGESGTGWVVWY